MSPPRQAANGNDALALIILGLGGLTLGGCALSWLAARTSLLLTGQAVTAPFRRAPRFVLALLHGQDPTAAWHRAYPAAGHLDRGWFWAFLSLALLAVAAVASAGLVRWTRHTAGRRADPARWATARHERRIAVPADPAKRCWRLLAGRGTASHRLLAGADCVSAVAFGPNGSGKTTSLIVPNVLDWSGPVVLTTAKPQDLEPLCTARAASGPVWVIAPGGAPGHQCVTWSPVGAAPDPQSADRIAEWMVEASGMTADPKARPWNAQARKYLKGLLLAAHHAHAEGAGTGADIGAGIGQWTEWIHAGERARDHVEDVLRSHGHDEVAREYASTWSIHEEGKGSVLFTALGLAEVYSRPGISSAIDHVGSKAEPQAGFRVADLFEGTGTLCIVTPSGEGDRFAPYFTTLLTAVIHEAETRAARTGGPLSPRLLLALDEAGNVFRYPRLPHLLTTARGNGIQLLLIYHDLAQVEHLYGGREVARTVVSNAKMRMLLPGVGDLDTLRYWSDLIGQTTTQTHGITTSGDGHRSRSSNEHADHLAPLHKLQQLPDSQAILLYQNLPPARVRLLPWYTNHRYRALRQKPEEVP